MSVFMEQAIHKEVSIKNKFDKAAIRVRKEISKGNEDIEKMYLLSKHFSSPKKFAKNLMRCEQRDNRGITAMQN